MGVGRSNLYSATRGGFNSAKSKSVRRVDIVNILDDEHTISTLSMPNSVTKLYKKGKLERERYYDEKGRVYLDIDYSEHGNSVNVNIKMYKKDKIKLYNRCKLISSLKKSFIF